MATPTISIIHIPTKKPMFNPKKFEDNMKAALDKTATMVKWDFDKTTETWSDKPEFKKEPAAKKGKNLEALVSTRHEVYSFVSGGTKRHYIAPKRAKMLRFPSGYKVKTRPRIIGSSKGGHFGPSRYSKGHYVSGVEAREFEKEIALRKARPLLNFCMIGIHRSLWV